MGNYTFKNQTTIASQFVIQTMFFNLVINATGEEYLQNVNYFGLIH